MRLGIAEHLRRNQGLSLRVVAARIGYTDPRYLARVLRKVRCGATAVGSLENPSATGDAPMS